MGSRRKWTEQLVESELLCISGEIGRMPTASELRNRGRSDLSSALVRRGGFRSWARRLGLSLKDCETHMAYDYEIYVQGILRALGSAAEMTATKEKYDLLVNEGSRVNVKSARWNRYGACSGHFFGIAKTWQHCDFFALVKIDSTPNPDVLWVPAGEAQQQTITLTTRHRFNEFTEVPRALLP